MADLTGRTALVTGSTSGFGRAIAQTLASHGAYVIVSGRDTTRGQAMVDTIATNGGRADFIATELVDPVSVQAFAQAAKAVTGRVDILVNNAGIMTYGPTAEITAETFDRDYAINVRAPFLLVGALAPAMTSRGWGSIINISSGAGLRANEGSALYGSTKAAVDMMTKNWALEYGPGGVRVNAIAAGPSDTEGSQATAGDALPGILAAYAETLPLRRVVTPQSVADAAAFLAGNESALVTGAIIRVDGGYGAI